jgi:hypothetical protein
MRFSSSPVLIWQISPVKLLLIDLFRRDRNARQRPRRTQLCDGEVSSFDESSGDAFFLAPLLTQDQRQARLAAANYDDLTIGRLRQLLRCLDSSPFQ